MAERLAARDQRQAAREVLHLQAEKEGGKVIEPTEEKRVLGGVP